MLYLEMLQSDASVLLAETKDFIRREREATAALLVRLAAVEARELYAPAGYSSMWEYCLGELLMSEDAAGRRLWASHKCREYPSLFDALADGRIQLTAIHLLAPHLCSGNVEELIGAASGRSSASLRDWLACRFPKPAVPSEIRPLLAPAAVGHGGASSAPSEPVRNELQLASSTQPARAEASAQAPTGHVANSHALARVPVPSTPPEQANSKVPLQRRASVEPLNAEQVLVRFTMDRRVLAKLERAIELLGHQVAPGDIAAVLERSLDALLPQLEKGKFAATSRPRAPRIRKAGNSRAIPAHVRREVWARDGGQCTFESATGKRCACRRGLHFDHVKPYAAGGEATTDNIRLLCAKHNELEARRRLGTDCMIGKRKLTPPSERTALTPKPKAPCEDSLRAVLTQRRFTVAEVSIGLSAAARLAPDAIYDERLRAALEVLRPREPWRDASRITATPSPRP